MRHSFKDVQVVWLRSVVDAWWSVRDRWITTNTSLTDSYSFEISLNAAGRPVLRTKDCMHTEAWLPLGGIEFAPPLLVAPATVYSPFSFVVPGVLDVQSLRSCISLNEQRLHTQRSVTLFPDEELGAAFQWWISFLREEEARSANMCAACRSCREELASIIVRRTKNNSSSEKKANATKELRRRSKRLRLPQKWVQLQAPASAWV